MALANVAELLYQKGAKVLIVDFDLEAPGIDSYFNDIKDLYQYRGLIDLLLSYKEVYSLPDLDKKEIEESETIDESKNFPQFVEPLLNFVVKIHDKNEKGGCLDIITAGRRDRVHSFDYSKIVRLFDWNDFYDNWNAESFFEWFRRETEDLWDVVLIDSRTGITEIGGVCTHQLANVVVIFTAPNQQNLDGVLMLAKSLSNPDLLKRRQEGGIDLIFVPLKPMDPFIMKIFS